MAEGTMDPRQHFGPDGGAKVRPNPRFGSPKMLNTVTVRHPEDPKRTMVVNKAAYDAQPANYELVEDIEATGSTSPQIRPASRERLVAWLPKDHVQLAGLTEPALTALPEYMALPEPRPTGKDAIVAALLKFYQANH